MIHKFADCLASIPDSTNVWQFCVVLPDAKIGENCNICAHVLIENNVQVGNNVTIKSGVQLWDGIIIKDDVFVGPNVTFTNDLYPRSKQHLNSHPKTVLEKGCSIGAGCTILCGLTIGENALIGAGSVVTCDVPSGELWFGNPARFIRKLGERKDDKE